MFPRLASSAGQLPYSQASVLAGRGQQAPVAAEATSVSGPLWAGNERSRAAVRFRSYLDDARLEPVRGNERALRAPGKRPADVRHQQPRMRRRNGRAQGTLGLG